MKAKQFLRFVMVVFAILASNQTAWADPTKCTATTDLTAGDVYYISGASTYSSTATVMGASTGGNNYPAKTFNSSPLELTLGGDATNGWTFSYKDGSTTYYLNATNTTGSNYLKRVTTNDKYGVFSISFSSGAAVITCTGKTSRNIIRYNSGSSCYSCYSSGQAAVYLYKKGTSYTITAATNNSSYGTVSLSGTVITASPKSGYRVSTFTPYTISPSGSATVSQSGNEFTVTASANTTVTINFEAIPTHKITFDTGGLTTISDATGIQEGATYNISQTPAASLTSSCGYPNFVGWTTATSIANASVKPTIVTSIEMGTSDITLHAVYSKTSGGGGATVGTTMFSENWTGVDASKQPTSPTTNGSTIYGSATITYNWVTPSGGSTTQTYTTGGPNSNENILISKKSGSWSVSGIPTGGATTLTVSYSTSGSGTLSVSTSTENVSISSGTITVAKPNDVSSFDLTFTNTHNSNNLRLDDISVVIATTSASGTTTYSMDAECCQNLGQINGSVNLTQATTNSLQVEWKDTQSGEQPDGYKLKLYADNSGSKGAQVGSEKTVAWSAGSTSGTTTTFSYDFNSTNGFTLDMNTTYWVSILPYSDGTGGKCEEGTEFVSNKDASNNVFKTNSCEKAVSTAVSKTGEGTVSWSAASVEVCSQATPTLTITPAEHYTLTALTITDESNNTYSFTPTIAAAGGTYTVTIPANSTETITANVTFKEDAYRTVVFKSNGAALYDGEGFDETNHYKQKVYVGGTPTMPSLADSYHCDDDSPNFYGWTQSTWEETTDDISDKTIYKATAKGAEVTEGTEEIVYNAVWVKRSGSETNKTIIITTDTLTSYASVDKKIGGVTFKSTDNWGKTTWSSYSYLQCKRNSSLYNSDAFPGYIKSVTITRQPSGNYDSTISGTVTLCVGSSTQPSTTCETAVSDYGGVTFNYTASNNYTYLAFSTGSTAATLANISITYTVSNITYTAYRTTCCNDAELTFGTVETPVTRIEVERTDGNSKTVEFAYHTSSPADKTVTINRLAYGSTAATGGTNITAEAHFKVEFDEKDATKGTFTIGKNGSNLAVGTYRVTISQAAYKVDDDNYCAASTQVFVDVKVIDQFIDNVNNTANYLAADPHKKEDTGSGYTVPALGDASHNDNTCNSVNRHFIGWISAADAAKDLGTRTLKEADEASDAPKVTIIKPFTDDEETTANTNTASGTTYYAVWGEQ